MNTSLSLLIPLTSLAFSASSLVQAAPATSQETGLPPAIKQPAEIPFKHPSFTFVRIKYSGPERRGPRGHGTWATDYPDADLNFTARFHETTRLEIVPAGLVMELTDPRLREYPFIYIAEGGNMHLSPEEVASLRGYLLGGGFLMVDDFWGESEWASLAAEFSRIFPERKPVPEFRSRPGFAFIHWLKHERA